MKLTGVVLGVALFAQSANAVSGTWTGDYGFSDSQRLPITLELKFDGTKFVSGVFRTVQNAATITVGKFDSKTGALRLEGEANGRDGSTAPFVCEAKVEKDTATGSCNFDNRKGDFKITRK